MTITTTDLSTLGVTIRVSPGIGAIATMTSDLMHWLAKSGELDYMAQVYSDVYIACSDQKNKRYRVDFDSGTAQPITPLEGDNMPTDSLLSNVQLSDDDTFSWIVRSGYTETPLLREHMDRHRNTNDSFGMNELLEIPSGGYDGRIVASSNEMGQHTMQGYTPKTLLDTCRSGFIWDLPQFNQQWMQTLRPNDFNSHVDISYLSFDPALGPHLTQQWKRYINRYWLIVTELGHIFQIADTLAAEDCDRPLVLQ